MAATDPTSLHAQGAPVEVLDVVVSLLAEMEGGEPADEFYSRLCEATCRLVAMRRAVIFLYDDERRQVRAVGAHGIDLEPFTGVHLTPATAEVVRRSLEEDRLMEVSEQMMSELPDRFRPLLSDGLLTCTPMAAGDRWYGVILADRAPDGGPLTEPQRHLLWTLGKTCALASSARIATRQRERAQQLSDRLDLARDVHDRVVQRLFGVSMALSADTLGGEARERCLAELQLALGELRAVMSRAPERARSSSTLDQEAARLRDRYPELGLVLEVEPGAEPPAEIMPVAVAVLLEAVRNARKHAKPTHVAARVRRRDGAFALEVVNDGVDPTARRGRAGMGLRLAAFQALEYGGLVEFGPHGEGAWRVRLAVPLDLAGEGAA